VRRCRREHTFQGSDCNGAGPGGGRAVAIALLEDGYSVVPADGTRTRSSRPSMRLATRGSTRSSCRPTRSGGTARFVQRDARRVRTARPIVQQRRHRRSTGVRRSTQRVTQDLFGGPDQRQLEPYSSVARAYRSRLQGGVSEGDQRSRMVMGAGCGTGYAVRSGASTRRRAASGPPLHRRHRSR
jgi:hypothetical protein